MCKRYERQFFAIHPEMLLIVALMIAGVLLSLAVSGASSAEVGKDEGTMDTVLFYHLNTAGEALTDLPDVPWTSGGPYGAPIRQIAVSNAYSQDHAVYAGTWGSGVYRLNDSLGVWEPRSAGLPVPRSTALVLSPDFAHDSTVFVALHGGRVYSTTNGGLDWLLAGTGLPWRSVRTLAVSPDYAADGTVYAGLNGEGVYRTENRGGTWSPISNGMPMTTVVRLATNPQAPTATQLYALTEGYQLYRFDDGATWALCAPIPDGHLPRTMAYTPDGGTLFVGSCSGVYYTTDECASWKAVTGIESIRVEVTEVLVSPNYAADSTLWFAGTNQGYLYRSQDGGISWTQLPSTAAFPMALAVPSDYGRSDQNTMFVGATGGAGGVYRSTDGGETWQVRSVGMTWRVVDLAASPDYANDTTVYAGLNGGGVFRSQDGGRSWGAANHNYPPGADANMIAFSPEFSDDGVLFTAGYGTGIYRSDDYGDSWASVGMTDVYAITDIAVSPADTLTEALILVGTVDGGAYRATDGGWSWEPITQGLVVTRVNDIAFSPAYRQDRTVFVSTDGSGIFRSLNGGDSWAQVTTGIPNFHIWDVAVSPAYANDYTVFVSCAEGIYRSQTGGDGWEHLTLSSEYGVTEIVFSPYYAIDRTVWAATTQWSLESEGGVFVSQDGGDTWQQFNVGLPQLGHHAIAVAPIADGRYDLFVGTETQSVWQQHVGNSVPKWTVLVYLNGDNNLDEATEELFQELEYAVADEPDLNIRVLWDRSGDGDTVLYHVLPDTGKYSLANYVEGETKWSYDQDVNMGSDETLAHFIRESRLALPAHHYLLALVDHGGGWSPELYLDQRDSDRFEMGGSGFIIDATNSFHYLSTREMGDVFSDPLLTHTPIDIVFYDACLMGIIEEAYEIAGGAHYMVASESQTYTSFPYRSYLAGINARSPQAQAIWMVDQHYASLAGIARTMAVLDLQQLPKTVKALNDLVNSLGDVVPQENDRIQTAFDGAQRFDYDYDKTITQDDGYVDLVDWLLELRTVFTGTEIASQAVTLTHLLVDAPAPLVVYERHQSGMAGGSGNYFDLQEANGISIYMPFGEFDPDLWFYTDAQLAWAKDTYWDDFVWDYLDLEPPQEPGDYVGGRGAVPNPLALYRVYLPMVARH